MSEPIRVFVGTSAGGEDAEAMAVCEYTLRSLASRAVDLTWIALSHDPSSFWHGWNTKGWGTPFSGLRWGIPAFCGFHGRAIYLDVDTILRADIAELWSQPMPPGVVALANAAGPGFRSCVMMLDCAQAARRLPPMAEIRRMHRAGPRLTDVLAYQPHLLWPFKGLWNCVDLKETSGLDDPRIKLIHYSSQPEQPHLRHALPRLAAKGRMHWYDGPARPHRHPQLEQLFDGLLAEAIAAGYPPSRYEPAEPFGKYDIRSYAHRHAA